MAALQKQCDLGTASACLKLGGAYQDGSHGLAADGVRAADLYDRACTLGDVHGCNNLAVMFEKGIGRPLDLGRALSMYEKSCAADHALACRNVGRLYRDGLGAPANPAKADEAFKKAATLSRKLCDAKVAEGCSNLGFMLRTGKEGLPQNEADAEQLLQRACDLGYTSICSRVHGP
jgi:TPR repeat protein